MSVRTPPFPTYIAYRNTAAVMSCKRQHQEEKRELQGGNVGELHFLTHLPQSYLQLKSRMEFFSLRMCILPHNAVCTESCLTHLARKNRAIVFPPKVRANIWGSSINTEWLMIAIRAWMSLTECQRKKPTRRMPRLQSHGLFSSRSFSKRTTNVIEVLSGKYRIINVSKRFVIQ